MLKTKGILSVFEGLSPSDIKNLFDRAKISSILSGQKELSITHFLRSIYELQDREKSENDYILFLKSKGLTQRSINKLTGISLRQIKNLSIK